MSNNTSTQQNDITPYILTEFISAIYLSLLSPVTIGANGLLLASIYKDPLKCFRTPITYFIVALAIVDLMTGLTVEPFFAVYYFTNYLKGIGNTGPQILMLRRIAEFVSTIGLSSSFLIVLALSCSQFIAINFPHKYKIWITTKRVVVCAVCSVLYFTAFSLIQLSEHVSKIVFYQIDLYLHATSIPILLLISHGVVLVSFYRHAKKSQSVSKTNKKATQGNSESSCMLKTKEKTSGQTSKHQRQLTIVTLMLSAILLLCSLPHIIVFYLFLYRYSKNHDISFQEELNINIALRVSDDVLFLKVLLDPFIYCWRLPKYRNALKRTLLCLGKAKQTKEADTQEMTTDHKGNERSS